MKTLFLNPAAHAIPEMPVLRVPAQTPFVVQEHVEISRGFACLAFTAPDGQRQIVEFFFPRDHIYIEEGDRSGGLRLFALSAVELVSLTDERTSVTERAERERRALAMARQGLINIATRQALPRCAHLFCEFFTRAQAAGLAQEQSCPLPIRQADIADALGLTPVHVNRTLRLLREKGLLTWRHGVLHIHDFAQLQECCRFDKHYLSLTTENEPVEAAKATFLPGKARSTLTLQPSRGYDGA
jgi:CRP-like cAMP-binding protein